MLSLRYRFRFAMLGVTRLFASPPATPAAKQIGPTHLRLLVLRSLLFAVLAGSARLAAQQHEPKWRTLPTSIKEVPATDGTVGTVPRKHSFASIRRKVLNS